MHRVTLLPFVVLGAIATEGCTHDFGAFRVGDGGVVDSALGDTGADRAPGNDSGSCAVMCGPQCAANCNGCSLGNFACGQQCVSSCTQCNGGFDFVVCVECQDGGARVATCGAGDPNGFCLNGNYPHCACSQDSDCGSSNNNQRCSNNQCTACGESLFSHNSCQTSGVCCKTPGPTFGQCSC